MSPLLRRLACLASTCVAATALAAPGDIIVPAHRSRDGTLIPANVPPSSGGTYMPVVSSSKGQAATRRPTSRGRAAQPVVPLFTEAQPIRR